MKCYLQKSLPWGVKRDMPEQYAAAAKKSRNDWDVAHYAKRLWKDQIRTKTDLSNLRNARAAQCNDGGPGQPYRLVVFLQLANYNWQMALGSLLMFYASIWRAREVKVYKNTEEQSCKRLHVPSNWRIGSERSISSLSWLAAPSEAKLPPRLRVKRRTIPRLFSSHLDSNQPSGYISSWEWLYKSERIWYIRDYYYCPCGLRKGWLSSCVWVNTRCHFFLVSEHKLERNELILMKCWNL